MPTQVKCVGGLAQGVVMRIIKLDTCGALVTGTGSAQIISDGFMKVMSAPQYLTGNRLTSRKANGKLCLNRKVADEFTNFEVTADFCLWHPGIPPNTIQARLHTLSESPTGTGFAVNEFIDLPHFSLEVWQPPDQACDSSGTVRYAYHAWPHLTDGKMGQFEISPDNPTILQIIANSLAGSPLWSAGASWLGANAISQGDHYLFNSTTTAPPSSACVIADYP